MGKYDDVWAIYGKRRGTKKKTSVLGYLRGNASRARVLEIAKKKLAPKGYTITSVKPYRELGRLARFDVRYSAFFGGITERVKDIV